MQTILSSIMAMTGRVLKQSPNSFHNFMLYLFYEITCVCTHRRSRKVYWWWNIHGFLAIWKNSQGIWFYMLTTDKWFRWSIYLCPHNPLKRDNLNRVGSLLSRKVEGGHNISHEYRQSYLNYLTTLIGASNSKTIG